MSTNERPPAVAGYFYPASKEELNALMDSLFDRAAEPVLNALPKAMISPHAGLVYSGPIAANLFQSFAKKPEAAAGITRVLLLGPSHRVRFEGIAVSSANYFLTPLGKIPVDRAATAEALKLSGIVTFDQAHAQEHSLEMQLPFIQRIFPNASILPLCIGLADPSLVAHAIKTFWGRPATLTIVSSDLSHYLPYERAQTVDRETTSFIEKLEYEKVASESACGAYPVRGLLKFAREEKLNVTTVDLRNSGDTAGGKDQVVGYGAYAFH